MRTIPDETPDVLVTSFGDAEDVEATTGPERRCILTGQNHEKSGLIRLVVGPDNAVWPDLGARLPGRGAWVVPNRAALAEATQRGKLKGALARAFRMSPPHVPDDLADRIGNLLQKRALDRLGLELRAGHIIFGSDKIAEWARSGRIFMLLHVSDAARDGVARLEQAFRVGAQSGNSGCSSIRIPVERHIASRALGRDNVVHFAVTDGKAARRIETDLDRWLAYALDDRMMDGESMLSSHEEGRE